MNKLFSLEMGKKRGIYAIQNKVKNRTYIGSSTGSFNKRYSSHMTSFRRKTNSPFLQRDYQLAPQDFVMVILEVIESKEAIIRSEQKWIDALFDNQVQCYNIAPTAGNTAGVQFSEARKRNLSEKMHLRLRDPSYYSRFLANQNKKRKSYEFVSPTNEEYTGRGVEEFCKKHGLSVSHMCALANGAIQSYKGWRLRQNKQYTFDRKALCKKNANARATTLPRHLLSPEGIVYGPVVNISSFCNEHNLHRVSIRKLVAGKIKQTKGWRLL